MPTATAERIKTELDYLPDNTLLEILDFVLFLKGREQRALSGKELVEQFAGLIPHDDLVLMSQAIKEGCEKVDGPTAKP